MKPLRYYGCVECQKYHFEDEQIFEDHIHHQSKHGIQYGHRVHGHVTHTDMLSADDAKEPTTRCAGALVRIGETFASDLTWTILVCQNCGARLMTIGGKAHRFNHESQDLEPV